MRRDIGGHTHGDTGGAVHEEVGEGAGQDFRFEVFAVIVGVHIDRIFSDILEHEICDGSEPGLRVPVGCGRIAVEGAEVALAIEQGVAEAEILRHADKGVINGRIAMGMIFTHGFADDTGAFHIRPVGIETQFPHGKDDPPVDRLESIPNVGQGAAHNDAHGIINIGNLEFLAYIYRVNPFAFRHHTPSLRFLKIRYWILDIGFWINRKKNIYSLCIMILNKKKILQFFPEYYKEIFG